jgi:CRISPR-associated protein Csa1
MFLLTMEERQEVAKGLLPKARRHDVPEELRGWNWSTPPLAPTSDIRLAAWEIGAMSCDTSRDLYLRRVAALPFPPSDVMRRGRVLHDIAAELILNVKKMIYSEGIGCLPDVETALSDPPDSVIERLVDVKTYSDILKLEVRAVWRYFHRSVVVALQDALSSQPRHTEDSLIAAALPLVMGWKIDGHRVGLSPHLSVDAFLIGSPMLIELKTGKKDAGHRLQVASYALAAESVYEIPFDLGCVTYLILDGPHVRVIKDLFVIDDVLREDTLDARDRKIALIESSVEPPVSKRCPSSCPYLTRCHSGDGQEVSIQPPVSEAKAPRAMPPLLGSEDLEIEAPRALSQIEEPREQ